MPDESLHESHLSPSEELIVGMLTNRGPMYGLSIVNAAGGVIAKGSIYVLLQRLEERGVVVSEKPGMTRLYRTTKFGRDAYRAQVTRREQIIAGRNG